MEHSLGLNEKRQSAAEQADPLPAPVFSQHWEATGCPMHRQFLELWLNLLRPHSTILYASRGTGDDWPMLVEHEHTLIGIDPSESRLSQIKAVDPKVQLARTGLQELRDQDVFDGILCVDTLEMVFPEDGPRILGNFQRALKSTGYLYFVVEIAEESQREQAYFTGRQLGLPILYGERVHQGRYQYYPRRDQVQAWIQLAGLGLLDDAASEGQHHFLVRKPSGSSSHQTLTHVLW